MALAIKPRAVLEQRLNEFKEKWVRRSALDLSGIGLRTDDLELARSKFPDLSRLKSLYLGKNQKSTARDRSRNSLEQVPAWLLEMAPKLTRLDLSGNRLTSVPETISLCSALQHLDLSENRFVDFPLEVCSLSKLTKLDVSGSETNFKSLPEFFGGLTELVDVRLNTTTMMWPPRDILEQGAKRITQFISDVVKNGGEIINEAKVVLVGNGDHGKTTLRLWLTENQFVTRPSTRGGEVAEISVQANRLDKSRSGRIKIWDFGGQDQYRAAQRSLFSSDALFVLVCKARGTIDEAGIPEWLQLIEHVNKQAKVILVFTHMDQVDIAPTLEHLPERLKVLVPSENVFELDATRADGGIDKIRARIVSDALGLDSFRHRWPIPELNVRRQLEDVSRTITGRQVLRISEFRDLCHKNGVESDRVAGVARSISNVDVGPEPEIVVLDPEWLLKAISYILDDRVVRERNGVLRQSDLDRIWLNHARSASQNPVKFEREFWKPLLAIMAYQGLAYNLNNDEWLVPECVTGARPKSVNWKADIRGVRREILLDAPIYGIAALMVAELHMFHVPGNRQFWKTGGFFRDPVSGDELLIQAEGHNKLGLEERGRDTPLMLERATSALRTVTNRYWPETRDTTSPPYDEHVPCCHDGCKEGYHVLNAIKSAYRSGRSLSACSTGHHQVRITELLHGVAHNSERDELLVHIKELLGNHHATKNEAPRILHVSHVDGHLAQERTLRLVCELTGEPVIETERTVRIEANWLKAFKTFAVGAIKGAGLAAAGDLGGAAEQVLKAGADVVDIEDDENPVMEFPIGFSERRVGEAVSQDVDQILRKMAEKGKMRQVCDRETGKWLWASKQAADANDPTQPKEEFTVAAALPV
jgi:small GTP-binding protein